MSALRPGHWCRQLGCAFSQSCTQCRVYDTQQAALRRQEEAAGSRAARDRRIVLNFNGDPTCRIRNSLIRFQPVIFTELANSLLVNYEATCELTNICSFTPRVQLYSLVSHRARAVSTVV